MAILKTQTTHVVEGLLMTNSVDHKVWNTNFNMPIPNLFSGSSTATDGFVTTYCNILDFSSRSLATLCPGFEVMEHVTNFLWCVTNGSCLNGISCVRQCWDRDSFNFNSFNWSVCVNIQAPSPTGFTFQFQQQLNLTGVDTDEVCCDAIYCANSRATSTSGDDVSISNCCIDMELGAVPFPTTCFAAGCRGAIWVEGDDLHFINNRRWEHAIQGTQVDTGANAGSLYVDLNHTLHWANSGGCVFCAPWRLCQFCSTFSNSSGPNPAPGSSCQGAIWVDAEFGNTHLAYIGCDGNKYLAGAGVDPTA